MSTSPGDAAAWWGRGLAVAHTRDFVDEFAYLFKAAINGCKTDIGHIVDGCEAFHDFFSDHGAGDFAIVLYIDFVDDIVDQCFDLGDGKGAFFAGPQDAGIHFLFAQFLMSTIAFNDPNG